jgi:hypothetical protein
MIASASGAGMARVDGMTIARSKYEEILFMRVMLHC